jgi:hypothetical protein
MIIETKELGLNLGLTTEKLLEELEENFPEFLPHPIDPINMVMYKSGQRSVIEWIKTRIEDG